MRLDKFLAESRVGQRKQVRALIKQGKVTVNETVILEAAYEVDETSDIVEYEGQVICHTGKRYLMFHKPAGCITARKDETHKTVLDYFQESERAGLFPVGRLDKDTEGLLLLTNDGDFDFLLMNPKHHVEKTYYFWALGTISEGEKRALEQGISIHEDGVITKPARLVIDQSGFYDEYAKQIDGESVVPMTPKERAKQYRKPVVSGYLTITEGKKHQVKRMLRAVGCYVIVLKRISIGSLKLDETLKPGEYRELTEQEIEQLLR